VQYALAFVPFVRSDIGEGLTVQIKIRLRLADQSGVPLDRKLIPSRRKAIVAAWWNHEWMLRQEAIMAYLSQGQNEFGWGTGEMSRVVFSAKPLLGEAPTSLDDSYLDSLKIAGKTEADIRTEIVESNVLVEEDPVHEAHDAE
jgi:hypothetical protein